MRLALLLALWSLPALAQLPSGNASFPPELGFLTLESPHFLVHFHTGEEELAQLCARYLEAAHERLVPLVGHAPNERTQVRLTDLDDSANGSAIAVPYNTVELLAALPDPRGQLNTFEDSFWQLIVHEYTHILHLDTIDGPSAILNRAFGKLLSPNAVWPRWFVEGWAVFQESNLSTSGRARSTLVDGQLRMQVLGGNAPTLETLSTPPLTWPRRSGWYAYGGRFLEWIARHKGEASLRNMSRENAKSIIPYQLSTLAREFTGDDLPALYDAWIASLKTTYRAQLDATGPPTPSRVLTRTGEQRRSPRPSLDGRLVYSVLVDGEDQPRLLALDVATGAERVVAEVNGDAGITLVEGGKILLSQPEVHRQFYTYDDLFLLDPATGATTQITQGQRLSEPDAVPGGAVVAVQRNGPGRTALVLAKSLDDLRAGRLETVYAPAGFTAVASPRLSPDGRSVAFLEHRGGSWDVRVLDLPTGGITDVTHDAAQDLDPSFSADGTRLLFTSDRTGIYDIYEVELVHGILARRTRVHGGAFEPFELDGRLWFLDLGAIGLDLARVDAPFDAGDVPPAPPPIPDSLGFTRDLPRYPVRAFLASDTLFPAYWLPLAGGDARGATYGALVGGFDVLSRYSYTAQAWWGMSSEQPGFTAILRGQTAWPSWSLQASRQVSSVAGAPTLYLESQWTGRATASWTFQRYWSSARIDAGYTLQRLSPAEAPILAPMANPVPARGTLGQASLTFSYTSARRWARGISLEAGRRFSMDLRGSAPFTLSDFTTGVASVSWSEYLPLPWVDHHVLALRLVAGAGAGDLGRRQLFGLGGPQAVNFIEDALALQSPTRILRGYPAFAFSGSLFALASAEYRFPIVDLEFGYGAWPIALRRLHGAVFCDVGDAFRLPASPIAHVGVGAELRAEIVVGYSITGDLRLGWAQGLSAGGIGQVLLLAGTQY